MDYEFLQGGTLYCTYKLDYDAQEEVIKYSEHLIQKSNITGKPCFKKEEPLSSLSWLFTSFFQTCQIDKKTLNSVGKKKLLPGGATEK